MLFYSTDIFSLANSQSLDISSQVAVYNSTMKARYKTSLKKHLVKALAEFRSRVFSCQSSLVFLFHSYLSNVRSLEEQHLGSGFVLAYACQRALQEAFSCLLLPPENR